MAAGHLALNQPVPPQEEFENSTKNWSLPNPHDYNNSSALLFAAGVQSSSPPQKDEHHTKITNHPLKPSIVKQAYQSPLTEKSSAQTNWTIIGSHKVPFNQCLTPADFDNRSSVIGLKLSHFASSSTRYPHTYHDKPKVVFHKSDKANSGMKNILIAKFSHGQPSVVMMRTFLSNRKLIGKFHVSFFDAKHIFVEFECFEDFAKFWIKQKGIINGFPVRFFKWDELFDPSKESSIIPVWIHLPRLPIYLFEERAILLIASALGRPLHVDANSLNRNKIGYATVCIELDILKVHPSDIWIQFGEGSSDGKTDGSYEGFLQKIVYGFMPPYCSTCSHIGHQPWTCKRYNFGKDIGSLLHSRSVLGADDSKIKNRAELNKVDVSISEAVEVLEEGEMDGKLEPALYSVIQSAFEEPAIVEEPVGESAANARRHAAGNTEAAKVRDGQDHVLGANTRGHDAGMPWSAAGELLAGGSTAVILAEDAVTTDAAAGVMPTAGAYAAAVVGTNQAVGVMSGMLAKPFVLAATSAPATESTSKTGGAETEPFAENEAQPVSKSAAAGFLLTAGTVLVGKEEYATGSCGTARESSAVFPFAGATAGEQDNHTEAAGGESAVQKSVVLEQENNEPAVPDAKETAAVAKEEEHGQVTRVVAKEHAILVEKQVTPPKLSSAAAEFTPKWAVLVEELVEDKKQSNPVLVEKEIVPIERIEQAGQVAGNIDFSAFKARMYRLTGKEEYLAKEDNKEERTKIVSHLSFSEDIEDGYDEESEEGDLDERVGSHMLHGKSILSDEMSDIPRPFKIKSAPNSPKGRHSSYDSNTYLLSRGFY